MKSLRCALMLLSALCVTLLFGLAALAAQNATQPGASAPPTEIPHSLCDL